MLTTAVVINLLVCTCRLSRGEDSEKKAEYVDFYKTIQAVDTGYKNPDANWSAADLMKLPETDIKERINGVYLNLACSYVYSGLHHLNLIRSFYEKASELGIVMFVAQSNDIFINEEIALILNSMHVYGMNVYMNEMLLMHTYMTHLQTLDRNHINAKREYLLKVHDKVCAYIARFTKENCPYENSYNDQFAKNVYNDEVALSKQNHVTLISRFTSSKKMIRERIARNKVVMKFEVRLNFHWYKLYMNGVVDDDNIMKTLLDDFGELIDWKTVVGKVRADQLSTSESFDNQLKLFDRFHHRVLNLFKITMLLIVRKHLVYINEQLLSFKLIREGEPAESAWEIKVFRFFVHNTKLLSRLTEFVRVLRLTSNKYFTHIALVLKEPVLNFQTSELVQEQIDYIEKSIAELQPHAYNCQTTLPKSFDNEYMYDLSMRLHTIKKENGLSEDLISLDMHSFPMPESLHNAGVYVQYIKHALKDFKYDVVDSFLEYTRDFLDQK